MKYPTDDESRKRVDAEGAPLSMSRRRVLLGGATAVAGAALALRGANVFAAEPTREIRIGFISPRSGALGLFGVSDPYTLEVVRKTLAGGINLGGRQYRVTILDRDTQSDPSRAAQLAHELISEHNIHLMLTTSTPETVNPVSDACEASSVPSLASNCPLESFFFGRGGKLGKPSPFKWTFDFSFGVAQFGNGFISTWDQVETNKKVAVMYPNDADGAAFRANMSPMFERRGYKVVDPGPFQDGTTDYSSQIALFNRENCQIFNSVALPPDFAAFWRQAAQQQFARRVRIVQVVKAGEFPSQVEELGALGNNLCSELWWSPVFPYRSELAGVTSLQLANGYERATGKQWNQQLGVTMALFDAAIAILKSAKDPTDRSAIRDVIPNLDIVTTLGRVNFKKGPYPNTTTTPMIGAQWVKAGAGSRFPLEFVTVEHVNDSNVPIQRKLVPYRV